jgi:hypothetical protein
VHTCAVFCSSICCMTIARESHLPARQQGGRLARCDISTVCSLSPQKHHHHHIIPLPLLSPRALGIRCLHSHSLHLYLHRNMSKSKKALKEDAKIQGISIYYLFIYLVVIFFHIHPSSCPSHQPRWQPESPSQPPAHHINVIFI